MNLAVWPRVERALHACAGKVAWAPRPTVARARRPIPPQHRTSAPGARRAMTGAWRACCGTSLQDLTQRATCASAARIAGLERAYFSKLFRSVMRVSFTRMECVRARRRGKASAAVRSICRSPPSARRSATTTSRRSSVCSNGSKVFARASIDDESRARVAAKHRTPKPQHRTPRPCAGCANNVSLPVGFLRTRSVQMKHRSSVLRFVSALLVGARRRGRRGARRADAIAVCKCSIYACDSADVVEERSSLARTELAVGLARVRRRASSIRCRRSRASARARAVRGMRA